MSSLIWTPEALGDIQRLYRFLAGKNPSIATKAITVIREYAKYLIDQPEIGRPMEGMERNYRELLMKHGRSGYLLFYRLDGKQVVILAVRHQKEAGYRPDEK